MFIIIGCLFGTLLADFVFEEIVNNNIPFQETTKETADEVKNNAKNEINESLDQYKQKPAKIYETEPVDIANEPYLLLNKFIHLRELACIVSSPGVGKTFLSIFIAKEAAPRKTLIFALDDASVKQLERYSSVPPIQCINNEQFQEIKESMKDDAEKKCQQRAIKDKLLTVLAKIEERKQKYMKELGIYDQNKIDNLLTFEAFAESELCSNADIVIIDSLNSLVLHYWLIDRVYLERLTRIFREKGKTLIILHHTNKKGDVSGPRALEETMDTVLILDELRDNYRRISLKKGRYLQGAKECIVKMVNDGPQAVRFEICEEDILNNETRFSPLENQIIQAMIDKDTVTFSELIQVLKVSNSTSVKNYLKRLEDSGYIKKADGKTWDVIKNCKDNITAP